MSCKGTETVLNIAALIANTAERTPPLWLPAATRLSRAFVSIRPCLDDYNGCLLSIQKANETRLSVLASNKETKTSIEKFYICCSKALQRPLLEASAIHTNICPFSVARDIIEPLFTDAVEFVSDYDPALHMALEDSTKFYSVDQRIFWHQNFLATSSDRYSDVVNKLKSQDIAIEPADQIRHDMQEVYSTWLNCSAMPIKATIRSVLIECGIMATTGN